MDQFIYIINKKDNILFTINVNNHNEIKDIVNNVFDYFAFTECGNSVALLVDCGKYGDFLISPIPKTIHELTEKLTNLLERT